MLKLKGGKLTSPKSKKPQPETELPTKPRAKRRQQQPKTAAIVVIRYLNASLGKSALGTKIDRILDGSEKFERPTVKLPPTPKKKSLQKPSAPTHPFFMGKAALKAADQPAMIQNESEPTVAPKLSSPRKIAGTPGKLRAQAAAHRATMQPPPAFGHVFGSAQLRMTKYPGMRDAPWPWKSVVHVRGEINEIASREQQHFPETERKLKRVARVVHEAEDLISQCSRDLRTSQSTGALRKPERIVTTGPEIQRRVTKELRTQFSTVASDSDSDGPSIRRISPRSAPHPALLSMYSSIESSLSPFDKFECETQAWTQKYSPKSAVEVLQPGREAVILRDWLRSTAITAVDTGTNRSTTGAVKPSKLERKKKRKRAADLDDFIISSDDELAGTAALEEVEEGQSMHERSPQKRSLLRGVAAHSPASKSGNAVLLSGPNGCGKTAAVYAVAKELGFEVFELNSGSRRSGKDVLEKIGDMTENHLVQQVSKALCENKAIESGRSVDNVHIDTPDPKQGNMNSFFKPAAGKQKTLPKFVNQKPKDEKASQQLQTDGKRPQPRQQKQSLILLEEVDVLFEEDKQFWMTVLTLATHSKRPIIMTCNDESRVPLNALSLHALLRFTPPSVELAVDYLLLLAAREGHLLQRSAVESLYQTRNHDLRGSIMELDQWCQIGVGDSTGGFGWMLDRYPPGVDVNDAGFTLRVASENTFFSGLGLVPHDIAHSKSYVTFNRDEELLLEAYERWNLNAEELLLPSAEELEIDKTETIPTSLLDLEQQSEINSAYDVSCGLGLRSGYDVSSALICFVVQTTNSSIGAR
jgi:DNA polymerase III delta prime subunit